MKCILILLATTLVSCSTTGVATSAQVVGSQVQVYNLVTSPATATLTPVIDTYTPAIINAINPPPDVPESVNNLMVRKCGDKPCKKTHKIPKSILPTSEDIAKATN